MIELTLNKAADLLGIENTFPDTRFYGISIDTRRLEPHNLFIALPGEQVDGHRFIDAARQKGAAAALVTRKIDDPLPQLVVKDPVIALGKLAAFWRSQFAIPLVAVTGSNGKTTLKNMLAAIFTAASSQAATLATQGTLNNHLGLPLTLAGLASCHRYAVVEIGMNHFGEIAALTQLARPRVAVITNAAASHLEGVGDVAGVARAKAEIFQGLAPDGTAVLNRDDLFYDFWRKELTGVPVSSFGFHKEADVRATIHAPGSITVSTPQGNIAITLPLLGKHNIANALAAVACALAVGIDLAAIKMGLENMTPAPGRLQLHHLENGTRVIDDTYNANPFSLQAAIETLHSFPGKKILVLGDMKELGKEAQALHQESGEKIRQAGIEHLFTYGELSALAAQSFGKGAFHFNEQDSLLAAILPLIDPNTIVLVKGSRSMRMEKVVNRLLNR